MWELPMSTTMQLTKMFQLPSIVWMQFATMAYRFSEKNGRKKIVENSFSHSHLRSKLSKYPFIHLQRGNSFYNLVVFSCSFICNRMKWHVATQYTMRSEQCTRTQYNNVRQTVRVPVCQCTTVHTEKHATPYPSCYLTQTRNFALAVCLYTFAEPNGAV